MSEDKVIAIKVEGGCVIDVSGVPQGYTYEIKDNDIIKEKESNHIDRVENAVDNMIYSWDRSALMNFAFEDRLEYYLESASEEEVNKLLKEFEQ